MGWVVLHTNHVLTGVDLRFALLCVVRRRQRHFCCWSPSQWQQKFFTTYYVCSTVTPKIISRFIPKMALSKNNTDALCLDTSDKSSTIGGKIAAFLRKCMYRYNLWTGLYMLERHEQYLFNAILWTFLCVILIYCWIFLAGIIQGIRAWFRANECVLICQIVLVSVLYHHAGSKFWRNPSNVSMLP